MTQIMNEKKDAKAVREKLEEITGAKVPGFWKKIFPDSTKAEEKKSDDGNS